MNSLKGAINLSSTHLKSTSHSKNPLLILHGLFGSKQNWQSISKQLHKRLDKDIYTLDLRNHGESLHATEQSYESMTTDIRGFIRERGLNKVDVIGHSMYLLVIRGGKTCMYLALEYPDLVNRICVVDMSPVHQRKSLTEGFKDIIRGMQAVDNQNVKSKDEADGVLQGYVKELSVRQFLLTNLKKQDDGFKMRVNLDVLSKTIEGLWEFPVTKTTSSVPALFIRGSKSGYVTEQYYPVIKQFFPNSSIVSLDAGHWYR